MDRDWYREPANLAELWTWLEERGEQPSDPAYFMAKPWKWAPEWREMQAEREKVA